MLLLLLLFFITVIKSILQLIFGYQLINLTYSIRNNIVLLIGNEEIHQCDMSLTS